MLGHMWDEPPVAKKHGHPASPEKGHTPVEGRMSRLSLVQVRQGNERYL